MNKTPQQLYQAKIESRTLNKDPHQSKTIDELQRLYDELMAPKKAFFKRSEPIKGVYIWGGVGRGKSMLMDMFFECIPDAISKRRVHFHEFMIEVHEFLHKSRKETDGEAAIIKCAHQIAKSTKLICFDEFHVVDVADAMILGRLFTEIFSFNTVLVATSNWPADKLYQDGLQRELFLPFIDLIYQRHEIVELNGDTDYRLQFLKDGGVYFSPLGLASSKKVDDLFSKLTDNISPHSETLNVKGRDITVNFTAKGVARFNFSELCEKPLGAEDYLTIANAYHTVFIEKVPKLNYDRRNEAKRLMKLIDALYENKTKLIMSADAKAEELYLGQDHAFEFKRTVSRLIEMQGLEYISAND